MAVSSSERPWVMALLSNGVLEHEELLRAKLHKVEALYFGAATMGERDAARAAVQRLRAKLAEVGRREPPTELQFSMPYSWAVGLRCAVVTDFGRIVTRGSAERQSWCAHPNVSSTPWSCASLPAFTPISGVTSMT